MSKVIKSVKKVISKVVKEVKRFAKSDLGKAILIGATVYLGGAALGAWNSPFQSINGAFVKGGSQIAGAGTSGAGSGATATAANANTAAGLSTASLPPAGIPSTTVTASMPAAASAASPATQGIVTGASNLAATMDTAYKAPGIVDAAAKTTAQKVSEGVATQTAENAAKKGIISRMMDGTVQGISKGATWMADNPMPSAMLLSAAGAAAAPDEIDMLQEKQRLDQKAAEQERQRINENLAGVKNVDIGAPRTARPLRFLSSGQPILTNGIINSNRG